MYESPITRYTEDIMKDVVNKEEGYLVESLHKVGFNIDTEELAKALRYDRDQYEKGFNDGRLSAESHWIPVRTRPMDSEEREYWEEHAGFTLTDDMAQAFDCPMPEDGQRIWVQTKNGFVFDDVCDSDCDGIGLEGNGDWDDIVAWMPMLVPEAWEGEEDENG